MPTSDPIVRRLCEEIVFARGELLIGTAELELRIGLVRDARHSATLCGCLDKVKQHFGQRGFALQWSFIGRDIVVTYSPLRRVAGGR